MRVRLALLALLSLHSALLGQSSADWIVLTPAATVNLDVTSLREDGLVFKLTPTQDTTITATPGPGPGNRGKSVILAINTSGTTAFTMSFGTGIAGATSFSTGVTDNAWMYVELRAVGTRLYAPPSYDMWNGPAFSKAGVRINGAHKVGDVATLSSGSVTVTLTGQSVYSSNTSYLCTPTSRTATRANIASFGVTYASGSQFTITSSNASDAGTVQFECVGN